MSEAPFPPVFTPGREAAEVGGELREAFERVLASGLYLLGPELEALESELAAAAGRADAIGVGSGTDALILTLRALGVGAGDEVVVPALTAMPTAAAVALAGARPVPVDVSASTACLDLGAVRAAIGPRTAAVILVHLYGYPAPARELAALAGEKGLALVEDVAQAFGATTPGPDGGDRFAGAWGVAACASFYPTKVLAALGDAGAVLTDDQALAAKVRLFRSHGHTGEYRHSVVAGNSRMDELQAAFLRVKLPLLGRWVAKRRERAQRLRELLAGCGLGFQEDASGHAYHLLAARHPMRDEIRGQVADRGANLMVHYPLPIGAQEAFSDLGIDPAGAPEAARWAAEELSLPTAPQVADEELVALAGVVREAAESLE